MREREAGKREERREAEGMSRANLKRVRGGSCPAWSGWFRLKMVLWARGGMKKEHQGNSLREKGKISS